MTLREIFIELVKIGLLAQDVDGYAAIDALAPLYRQEVDALFGPGFHPKELAGRAKEYLYAVQNGKPSFIDGFMKQFEEPEQ